MISRRMIMLENQDIHGAILAIMETMRLQGTSPGSLKNFETAYTETQRKTLEAAYVDILLTSELPDWSDDKNLMDFLISLGR
jgi:hypothetical protein